MSKNKFWYRLMTAMVTLSLTIAIGGVAIAKEKVVLKICGDPGAETATAAELVEAGRYGSLINPWVNAVWNYNHPDAKVKVVFSGRLKHQRDNLLTHLASGNAPAIYQLSPFPSLHDAIELGVIADITKWINNPELKAKYFDHMSPIMRDYWKNEMWLGDHCYGMVKEVNPFGVFYRKDWLKEAGIFNAQGVGAPPDHWTLKDFREIAKKITDSKKERWGLILRGEIPKEGSLIKRFGVEEVIPDKSGKYTWRAGFTLPTMVDFMSFTHDMIFKDKSILTGTEYGWGECWHGFFDQHRGGMILECLPAGIANFAVEDRKYFSPLHFTDAACYAPLPVGRGGLRPLESYGQKHIVNPLLTDAEKKAAVEYLLYDLVGKGQIFRKMSGYFSSEARFPFNAHAFDGLPDAPWMKSLGYNVTPDYIHEWNLISEEKAMPSASRYGLYVKNFIAVRDALEAAYRMILSTANINVEEELAKAASIANTKLNYKDKEITPEKLKDYYTVVGEYYKETAPDFYKNTFQPLLEKYYKVW